MIPNLVSFACTRSSTCLQTKLIIRNCLHQIYINFILFCSSLHHRLGSVSHMGVDITTWRQRLGNSRIYSQKDPHHCLLGSFMRINVRYGSASHRLCAALAILLFMAGVEISPGPVVTCAELATMINKLTTQVAGLSAQVNAGFQQCNVKLDGQLNNVTDLKTRCAALETAVTLLSTDRDNLQHEVSALKAAAGTGGPPSTSPPVTLPPSASKINDVVREINLRASKKANFVLSDIVPSPSQSDGALVATLLCNKLGIDTTIVRSTRLGKPSANVNRPQLLLITVSPDVDARTAIRSATKLHCSTDDHIRDNVYLNTDLTPEQCKADYDLRTELKRCRAAGEQNLIIRDGRLVTKQSRPAASSAVPVANPWLLPAGNESMHLNCDNDLSQLPHNRDSNAHQLLIANNIARSNNQLLFSLINIQSINNKSMLISDIVTDNVLDVMVLTETWHSCSSDVPLRRAAPVSFSIIDAPRSRHGDDDAGVNHGGIAVLHLDIFSSRIIAMPFHPTSFELLGLLP